MRRENIDVIKIIATDMYTKPRRPTYSIFIISGEGIKRNWINILTLFPGFVSIVG